MVKDRDRSGLSPSTTAREDRLLCHLSLTNRRATSRMLKRDFEDATGAQVSTKTVRRRLVKAGLTGCVAAKRPLFTLAHRKKCLDWCRERKDLTNEQWKKVLMLDKSVFELIPTRRVSVRRKKNERYHPDCLNSTVKHGGGKLQVWGCMAANGV